MDKTAFTLLNPRTGDLAFKVFEFDNNAPFDHLQRPNYYSLIVITQGSGSLKADTSSYPFVGPILCCFAPYQPYLICTDGPLKGMVVQFHADYFCIYRHQHEIASNGTLFNTIFAPPFFSIPDETVEAFLRLGESMKNEVLRNDVGQQESIILYLKLFLITAIRIRTHQLSLPDETNPVAKEPPVLQQLQEAIERHHRQKHAVSDYADLLRMSSKSLSRLAKKYYNKTLRDLITERLIIEAKRELYLTSQPIKTVAFGLGFTDEFYFSRFFKKNTDISPQLFRERVGFAKAEG